MRYTAKVKKEIFEQIKENPSQKQKIFKEHKLSEEDLFSWSCCGDVKNFRVNRIFKNRKITKVNLLYP
jgi:hypothetical protein